MVGVFDVFEDTLRVLADLRLDNHDCKTKNPVLLKMSVRKRQITHKEKVAPVKFRPFSLDYLRQVYEQEGSIRLQNEVEMLPFADQAYIIRNIAADVEGAELVEGDAVANRESKLNELIVKDLLKMFYRQVRAYKFQYDSTGRLDTDLTVSLYGDDLGAVLEDIYTMTNAPEIRGVIHYLKEVFLESNIYDLRYSGSARAALPYYIDQYYTYLKFKYVKSGSDGFNLDRDIKLDVIPRLGRTMTDIFKAGFHHLDDDAGPASAPQFDGWVDWRKVFFRREFHIFNDVQYMLEKDYDNAASSCFNTLTDIVQFSRFSDQPLSNFLTSILSKTYPVWVDIYEGKNLANYIRGVLIVRVLKYGVDKIYDLVYEAKLYEKILSEKRKPYLFRILINLAERISQETPQK